MRKILPVYQLKPKLLTDFAVNPEILLFCGNVERKHPTELKNLTKARCSDINFLQFAKLFP